MPNSTRHLLNSIHKDDEKQIAANLQQYIQRSAVQFDKVLAIPPESRIPNLTHVYGFEAVHKILAVLLTKFNNSLNLVRPMSADQVRDCSFEMVMTTEEDFLSIEDYMLFFKGAKEGKYGRILDRMDHQTVFALLEEYRQERHRKLLAIREAEHAQHKAQGPSERVCATNELETSFYNIASRLQEMKEKLKEQREINKLKTWQNK